MGSSNPELNNGMSRFSTKQCSSRKNASPYSLLKENEPIPTKEEESESRDKSSILAPS